MPDERVEQSSNGQFVLKREIIPYGRYAVVGVSTADSYEQAVVGFKRGAEYLRLWVEMLEKGETPGIVVCNPSNTTVEEAVKRSKKELL